MNFNSGTYYGFRGIAYPHALRVLSELRGSYPAEVIVNRPLEVEHAVQVTGDGSTLHGELLEFMVRYGF